MALRAEERWWGIAERGTEGLCVEAACRAAERVPAETHAPLCSWIWSHLSHSTTAIVPSRFRAAAARPTADANGAEGRPPAQCSVGWPGDVQQPTACQQHPFHWLGPQHRSHLHPEPLCGICRCRGCDLLCGPVGAQPWCMVVPTPGGRPGLVLVCDPPQPPHPPPRVLRDSGLGAWRPLFFAWRQQRPPFLVYASFSANHQCF